VSACECESIGLRDLPSVSRGVGVLERQIAECQPIGELSVSESQSVGVRALV
jgi:hypothetical protein